MLSWNQGDINRTSSGRETSLLNDFREVLMGVLLHGRSLWEHYSVGLRLFSSRSCALDSCGWSVGSWLMNSGSLLRASTSWIHGEGVLLLRNLLLVLSFEGSGCIGRLWLSHIASSVTYIIVISWSSPTSSIIASVIIVVLTITSPCVRLSLLLVLSSL